MVFLNAWVFFWIIALILLYKKHKDSSNTRQINLLYLSLFFMLIAFAQPALKNKLHDENFNSQEYIIAIDASYSMQADDLKPTRYILAKEAIQKLLKLHPKDRFTLFAFTSNTLLISPPTTDTEITMQALNTLNPNYILTKSTNLRDLFETVAKSSFKQKKLIVFSDGGDEQDINSLLSILKKNKIEPYLVATATSKGATLKKDGKYLKDNRSSLVVSKINPLLKDLASLSDGKYYELSSLSIVNTLSDDISTHISNKNKKIKVQSYKELFYIPLSIAILLYFLAITSLHQIFVLVPLLLIFPNKANANILDFYYLNIANNNYKEAKYLDSVKAYKKLKPSVASYYNIASSYYKARSYKKALQYYTQIRTQDKKLKAKIFYNIGNCAFKLKLYDKAEQFYIYSLILHEDKDAKFNLNLIRKHNLKTKKHAQLDKKNIESEKKKKNKQSKNNNKNNNKKSKDSKSSRESDQSTNGSGNSKKKKKASSISKKKNKNKNPYKMGYKAYEIINKGYSDEKEPW